MTDDPNLANGEPMPDRPISVVVSSDSEGHWVQWHKGSNSGILGPYLAPDMAEDVRNAKERELSENAGHIDDAL